MSIYTLFKSSPLVYNISMNKLRKELTKEQLIAYYILFGIVLVVVTNANAVVITIAEFIRHYFYIMGWIMLFGVIFTFIKSSNHWHKQS